MFYQVLHPWHWLTYGQNATALAAVAAVVGLIGLYFYTRYTRRMMKMQESTTTATVTPILVLQGYVNFQPTQEEYSDASALGFVPPSVTEYSAILKIRNVGAGAALFLRGWHQEVSKEFVDDPQKLFNKTPQSRDGASGLTELLHGESTTMTFERMKPDDLNRRWLFVVETIDQINERHQLKVVRTPIGDNEAEVSVSMVHREQA
jgi:hypothetical protein